MSDPSKQPKRSHFEKNAWLYRPYHSDGTFKRIHELELKEPSESVNRETLNRVYGSLLGLAIGDALGASVEFRPHEFLAQNPVTDLQGGGTWGLNKGEFTDDTSMALCLANSLVACCDFIPYDQLVRYKWWFRNGYMSSTGKCFDIGAATKRSLIEFEHRQQEFMKKKSISEKDIDSLHNPTLLLEFNVDCSESDAAGNGALMRLCVSGRTTHGDKIAYDACRYYGALIVAALRGETIDDILDPEFYKIHRPWFNNKPLHKRVMEVIEGSYKKPGGYKEGIRGKGFIISALEAALWALWKNVKSFDKGVLDAVNLGDDTDTTAAIYGQLAGALFGYERLPRQWRDEIYGREYILCLSKWIVYNGERWDPQKSRAFIIEHSTSSSHAASGTTLSITQMALSIESLVNCEGVCEWLKSLGEPYNKYIPNFEKHIVDGFWLLNFVSTEGLVKYGIENEEDRNKILGKIRKQDFF
ncbi:hypothetical protein I4U23_017482 [Adineta vaga]|nr:hypothetical protein I4U23_017482 [Adineta vaga]